MDFLAVARWCMKRWERQVHVESYLALKPSQELQVFPKSNGEPLQDSWAEKEFHYAHAFHAQLKTVILQPVLPKWPSFSSITLGPANICVRPPRTARHFAAAPANHYQPPGPPWLEAFRHSAQTLQLLGLWKHSQNVFMCNQEACLENPGCKHFSLPGGYTQLFCCKILRHKRDIPS